MLHKPLTEAEQQIVKFFDVRAISEDFIKNTCQPQYLKAKTPEGREFWTNQARKSKEATDRLLFNPDTHCVHCGEFLSIHGHCWQCHWPPMDPAQDKAAPQSYCNGQCGICSCQGAPTTYAALDSDQQQKEAYRCMCHLLEQREAKNSQAGPASKPVSASLFGWMAALRHLNPPVPVTLEAIVRAEPHIPARSQSATAAPTNG